MRTRIAGVWMLMVCGTALGQNVLDRPLDRNQQVGSGGLNPARPDLGQELRFRNAIVTGNAPGGFSFRGDVGYRAPGEFFGNLGSNENFSFRRDSYYSGLGGMGIRGTDALQYQFAMTTGNAPPPGLAGSGVFSRTGADVTAQSIQNRQSNTLQQEGISRPMPDPFSPGADLRGLSQMSIRSPSSYVANRGLTPVSLGWSPDEQGNRVEFSASALRGLSFDAVPKPREEPKAPESGNRIDDSTGVTGLSQRTETKVDSRVTNAQSLTRTAYDELMDRIRKGGAVAEVVEPADSGVVPEWQKQLEELREQLGEASSTKRGTMRVTETRKPASETKPEKDDARSKEVKPETAKRIRDAGTEVERLAPEGYDAYSSHMQAAQEHIAAGRFFYAEERFAAALGVKSGDPMAAVGRVHAQLGAGIFLSAAINLRSLFAEHPEVVSLKYKAELMPSKERVAALIDRLGEMVKAADERRRDSGLLLAYLGFQIGDLAVVKRGLEVLNTPDAAVSGPAGVPDPLQRLGSLLEKVWLTPPAAPAPAAPAPAAPAPQAPAPEPGK